MAEGLKGNGSSGAPTGDDLVLPFQTVRSGVMGRLVRLGTVADTIVRRHDYPEPVSEALGQALALTAMLGAALKFEGKLIVQTKTDGVLDFLVVNFETPGRLRGYASFDKERWASLKNGGEVEQGKLLGSGHLAMTIDQGGSTDRYQGIVSLDRQHLGEAALTYFRQSEQLPTFIRLAVARHYVAGEGGAGDGWRWRAGGLMLQYIAPEGGRLRSEAATEEEEQRLIGEDDDDWTRTRLLAATVEDHELLDPTLAPERLLIRLFHEEGVRVYPPLPLEERCRCSRERVETFLTRFGREELSDLLEEDGGVTVTCEFCNTKYRFTPEEFGG